MNKKLDEALCRDFPKLFSHRYADMSETCMCWGFECGDGWEPIIREAAIKIEAINNARPEYEWIRASQVKEKYGTLRFYLTSDIDEAFVAVSEAEEKSESICEQCGGPGELRGYGWVYTACDVHTRNGDLKTSEYEKEEK